MAEQTALEKLQSELETTKTSIANIRAEITKLQQKLKNFGKDTGYSDIPDKINIDVDDGYEYLDIVRAGKKIHKLVKTLNTLSIREKDLLKRL